MIPDKAVEAALRVLDGREEYLGAEFMRTALEAAAPHLVAQAWDEGERTGRSRAMRYMSDEPNLPLVASNPYRPAK